MCEHRLRNDEQIQECLDAAKPICYVNGKDKYAYYYWGNPQHPLLYIDKSIENYESGLKAHVKEKNKKVLKLEITTLRKFKRMQYDFPQAFYDTDCYICSKPVQNHPNWCLFCYKQFCSKCVNYKSQYACPYCAQDFKMMTKCVVCNKEKKEGKEFNRCCNCFAPFHNKCRGILTYSNTDRWLCCQCEEHSLLSYMGFLLPPINIVEYPGSLDKFKASIQFEDPLMYEYFMRVYYYYYYLFRI